MFSSIILKGAWSLLKNMIKCKEKVITKHNGKTGLGKMLNVYQDDHTLLSAKCLQ